jgi:hypothetical protein
MGFMDFAKDTSSILTPIVGGWIDYNENKQQMNIERARQDEYARNSISWRVADAKKAGIHPLAALGAATNSPSSVVGGQPSMAQMGQDISRALSAMTNKYQRKMLEYSIDNADMDNEMKRMQLNEMKKKLGNNSNGVAGNVLIKPSEDTSRRVGRMHMEAADKPLSSFIDTPDGGKMPTLSEKAKEATEDQLFPELVTTMENYIAPLFSSKNRKPRYDDLSPAQKKAGYKDWEWSAWRFRWLPVKHKGREYRQKLHDRYKKTFGYKNAREKLYDPTRRTSGRSH